MKKGDIRTKTIDGKQLECSFVGKGRFSTCWRHKDTVYSFCKNDWGKELVNLWCETNNPHLPSISDVGTINGVEFDTIIYSMPFYQKLTAKSPAWQHYKALKTMWDEAFAQRAFKKPVNIICIDRINDFNDAVQESDLPDSLKDAISELSGNMLNYDKMLFEFTPRNLATDQDDNLVLLDVVFSLAQI